MNRLSLNTYIMQAMVATIYVALVQLFHFASFGLIQFRIAEILMIFVLFDKKYIIGVTLGCFVANLIGGGLWFDVIFGTFATLIAAWLMVLSKSKLGLALLWPAIINGLIVGLFLTYGYLLGPLYFTIPSVFIGEFAVLFVLGLPLYYGLKKNQGFMEFIHSTKKQ
jgi:uncharacterized membrane protein